MDYITRTITVGYWYKGDSNHKIFLRLELPGIPSNNYHALAFILTSFDKNLNPECHLRTGDIIQFEDDKKVFLAKEESFESIFFQEITNEIIREI